MDERDKVELQRQQWLVTRKASYADLNFCPSATVEKTPHEWALSQWLATSPLAWAASLREMYAHPMAFPGSLSPAAGEMLRALIYNIAPHYVMEIGSLMGISTVWIASALQELEQGQLQTIDLFEDLPPNHFCSSWLRNPLEYIRQQLTKADLNQFVELYRGDSKIIAPQIAEKMNGKIDFLFIDGDHTPQGCYLDFMLMEKFVSTGGYILFHDIFPEWSGWEGPGFVVEHYIKNNSRFELCPIYTAPLNFGFALVRKLAQETATVTPPPSSTPNLLRKWLRKLKTKRSPAH